MVYFDRSVHFGRSERNVPFYRTKLKIVVLSIALPYPAYKYNNQTHGVSVEVCAIGLRTWNFRKFKALFLVNEKRPLNVKKVFLHVGGFVSGLRYLKKMLIGSPLLSCCHFSLLARFFARNLHWPPSRDQTILSSFYFYCYFEFSNHKCTQNKFFFLT